MKKSLFIIAVCGSLFMTSCGNHEEIENSENTTATTAVAEEVIEEPVAVSVSDFIKGNWNQIGQDCDSTGNNCSPITNANWEFTNDSVTWSKFTLGYTVQNDTILLEGSPYVIESELADTIIFHAIKTNRYMKLVRMN